MSWDGTLNAALGSPPFGMVHAPIGGWMNPGGAATKSPKNCQCQIDHSAKPIQWLGPKHRGKQQTAAGLDASQ